MPNDPNIAELAIQLAKAKKRSGPVDATHPTWFRSALSRAGHPLMVRLSLVQLDYLRLSAKLTRQSQSEIVVAGVNRTLDQVLPGNWVDLLPALPEQRPRERSTAELDQRISVRMPSRMVAQLEVASRASQRSTGSLIRQGIACEVDKLLRGWDCDSALAALEARSASGPSLAELIERLRST